MGNLSTGLLYHWFVFFVASVFNFFERINNVRNILFGIIKYLAAPSLKLHGSLGGRGPQFEKQWFIPLISSGGFKWKIAYFSLQLCQTKLL
jgi:hypothetical protein